MKTSLSRITKGSVLLAAGCFAFAFPAIAGGTKGADVAAKFKSMDTNGDGKVSAEEHAAGARQMFNAMDTNQDGQVTAAEMDAYQPLVAGKKSAHGDMTSADKIKVIDKNGDGILSASEHAAGSAEMFAKMDTNHDGFLDLDEMTAGHAKMMHKDRYAQ